MRSHACMPALAVLVALCGAFVVDAHVSLKFPSPATPVDFTDNFRTSGFCGFEASGNDGSNLWNLPPLNTSSITPLSAGSTVTMAWNLHYPHNGGYELDVYRLENDGTLGERISCEANFGCGADGTANSAEVILPAGVTCDKCLVRLTRQALEWGGGYLFRSCAMVSITEDVDECQGCSGHGSCVEGQCQCDSSPETGFWYGKYCDQENECETDDHCGEGGVCQDVKSPTAPTKQCFCKEGWFGDEVITPGGSSKRTCTRQSEMVLGDHTQWASEYADSRTSTPTGNMTVYWTVDREAGYIEYAISAITDAWVSIGVRPESVDGVEAPTGPAPVSEGEAEAEAPAAEGEAEAPAAEGEAESESAAHTYPVAEGEAEAPAAEGESATHTYPAPEGEAEGESATHTYPASEGEAEAEAPAAEGEAEGEAPASEGEAESEATSTGTLCTAFAGSENRDTCGLAATGMDVLAPANSAPEAEPEAEAESEAAAQRRRRHRHLLEAEPETAPESESESGPAVDTTGRVRIPAPGACGALITPSSAFPMINLDISMAMAVDGTFRVYDAFTPSRSRPLHDVVYGGKDDIIDAVGKQTTMADGSPLTLIKFRKPVSSDDGAADYCYVEGVNYRLAYAYGQSSPRGAVSHKPASSLETGTGSNTQFYQPDALLYHGGGISAGNYDTRGHFPVNFNTEVGPGACAAPTTLANGKTYQCMQEQAEGYTVYWTADEANGVVDMAASAPTTAGWVGIGFPSNGAAMIGSQAIIGSPGNVKMYRLTGYAPPAGGWPEEDIEGVRPDSLAVTRTGSNTIVEFQRDIIPGTFDVTMQPLVGAFHRTSENHFMQHSAGTNQGFNWDPTGNAEASDCPLRNPNWNFWVIHGVLMAAGWGVAIPLGVVIAGTMRDKAPAWFQAHRALNYIGLASALAAWIIALVKLGPINFGVQGDEISSAHSVVGMIVMILGVLQPLNALFRPHPGEKNRWIFNWVHWTAGRVAWFGGMLNVFLGIFLFRARDGECSPTWPIIAYSIWLALYFVLWFGLEARKRSVAKAKRQEEEMQADKLKSVETSQA